MYSAKRAVVLVENAVSERVEKEGGGKVSPRTVRSAGLEEMMAAAKAMVRSAGSLRCACAMLALWDGRRWVRCKSGCEDC